VQHNLFCLYCTVTVLHLYCNYVCIICTLFSLLCESRNAYCKKQNVDGCSCIGWGSCLDQREVRWQDGMRDFIICAVRQTLSGEMGYVSHSVWPWRSAAGRGQRFVLFPQKSRPPLAPHPSVQLVPGILSLWVEVVGWSGCDTDHPPLSVRGVNECNCISSHPVCTGTSYLTGWC
jgi:hypothetical protein